MGHGLELQDKMAYRLLGGDPWHIGETRDRLTALGEGEDGKAFFRAAGLDYELEKVEILTPGGAVIKDIFGIVEKDSREPIPGVAVGKVYEILQPDRLREFGDAIVASDPGAAWETAFSIRNRKRIVCSIALSGTTYIERGGKGKGIEDKSFPYATISTTFDAKQRTCIFHTNVRAVCQNTFSAGLGESLRNDSCYMIRHSAGQEERLAEAAKALGHAISWHSNFAQVAQELADTPFTNENAASFFASVLVGAESIEEGEEIAAKRLEEGGKSATYLKSCGTLLLDLFTNGTGNYGQDKYDALNAITEYVDRQRARIRKFTGATTQMRLETALESSQFGDGAKMKARALKLLR